MPQFKLEFPDRLLTHSRTPRMIYTKNLYSKGVKVQDWNKYEEFKPIDTDPYCPGKVNHFLAHYDRLGMQSFALPKSTTHEMLEQIYSKEEMKRDKVMMNYYTFNNNVHCLDPIEKRLCSAAFSEPYLTTMSSSYRVPFPYRMTRVTRSEVPNMQNRKYRTEVDLNPCKFYDETFNSGSRDLQGHKGFRWTSYNPMTGTEPE